MAMPLDLQFAARDDAINRGHRNARARAATFRVRNGISAGLPPLRIDQRKDAPGT
jgi:hypothetical protein